MAEPFVGEIRMFAGNFAPRGWAFCDGQLLAISQNDALFSLLGTIYGGDGQSTFALPDLRGRLPVHAGTGSGLSPRQLGQRSGAESVTLTANEMPAHVHPSATTAPAGAGDPGGRRVGNTGDTAIFAAGAAAPDVAMSAATGGNTGGSQPHSNLMPFLCVSFIIALFGIYPSRS